MNLIIDQGNTAIKLAIFEGNKILSKKSFLPEDEKIMYSWLNEHDLGKINVLVCNVSNKDLDLSFLEINQLINLDHKTVQPLELDYKSPSTLGYDRLANAVGAYHANPESNSLVIDLGTCIKYDLVNSKGQYLGGNISPGMMMRFKALSDQTASLPSLDFKHLEQEWGTDTNSSIRAGVQLGITEEINGFINRYSEEFQPLTIFMTGGDSKYFDKAYKNAIFADSDLTLKGLNEILNYNVEPI